MSDSHQNSIQSASSSAAENAHAPSAADHGHHEMHYGLYCSIGLVLVALTGVTVALSYHDFGSRSLNIIYAMLLASFKVSLVGAIFMHLKGEKPTIWRFLYFTAFFVLGLFVLTWFAWENPIFGTIRNTH